MPDYIEAVLQTDWGQGLVLSIRIWRQMRVPEAVILRMLEDACRSKHQRTAGLRKSNALEGQLHTFTSN